MFELLKNITQDILQHIQPLFNFIGKSCFVMVVKGVSKKTKKKPDGLLLLFYLFV